MAAPKKTIATPAEDRLAQLLAVLEARTKLLAFFFGLCFVAALLVLAVWYPQPTAFQYTVFRIVLALAAAGVAGVIPGMIRLKAQPGTALLIHAGGALAVFVMVYMLAPAALNLEEKSAPPSPPQPQKKESPVEQPLKISGVDAIEDGVYILNFTPPRAVHFARISNIGDDPLYISLVGFPEPHFYTNLLHEELTFKEHADREISFILPCCNIPAQKEYLFQINDSAGGTARIAIRLNEVWGKYFSEQKRRIHYKDAQGASKIELHQEAKQLIAASGAKDLAEPLQEALAGQLLAAADQSEAAALAYFNAEKEAPEIAKRFITYSSPDVMTDLADIYKDDANLDREQYWRTLAGNIFTANQKQEGSSKKKRNVSAAKQFKSRRIIQDDKNNKEEQKRDEGD